MAPCEGRTKEVEGTQQSGVGKVGGFHRYPTMRDHPLKGAYTWIQGKRVDDAVGPYWRVHDKLYDLTHFAEAHPGGKEWITITKGTDITEAFESSHVSTKPEQLLAMYYVNDISTPRNSPYTFHEDGFYKTFKRKVRPVLKTIGCGPTWTMVLLQDGLALTFLILTLLATATQSFTVALLAGIFLSMTVIGAHNFFHQRDNFRMYYFDLSLFSSYEWRITHGLSHHLFPNTINDIEISFLEPYFSFLPKPDKPFFQRYGSWVYELLIIPIVILIELTKRVMNLATGLSTLRPENFLPFVELLVMANMSPSFGAGFKLWLVIHMSFSVVFVVVGLIAGHHHPDIYHHGDRMRDNPDWGLCQLDAIRDRVEVTGNLFLVLTTFGNHSLHHLLPTVDHSKLPLLYPIFLETCKEFKVPFAFVTVWEMAKGKYLQQANNKPNTEPPGYKHITK